MGLAELIGLDAQVLITAFQDQRRALVNDFNYAADNPLVPDLKTDHVV